jgi:hypothetical protein
MKALLEWTDFSRCAGYAGTDMSRRRFPSAGKEEGERAQAEEVAAERPGALP